MTKLPPPDNVGQTALVEYDDGSKHHYTVVDEIVLIQPDNPNRALCFQQLRSRSNPQVLHRFCYCYADKSGWVITHHRAYITDRDFQIVIQRAVQKGWFDLKLAR